MNIIEKNRLDISELKIKFNWDQKTLLRHFPEKNVFRKLEDPKKGESGTFAKLFSLICILFLSLFVVPYIPINSIKNSLNTGIPNASVYIGVTVLGIYLYWLFSRIWIRNKTLGKRHLFNLKDLIPFIIGFVVYFIHFSQDYQSSNGNSFSSDPISNLFDYNESSSESTILNSEFVFLFLSIATLYLIIGGCIYVIYSTWLISPNDFQKLLEFLVEKKVTHKRKIKKVTDFGFIEDEKILWKIPKIGRIKEEKVECYVKTILPDTNLVDFWKLTNPKYVRNFFLVLGIGFYLMYMCFGAIDQVLYNPEMATADNRLTMIMFIVLSILFIFGLLYLIKGVIFRPVTDYHKVKNHVNKEIGIRISNIYEKVGTESNDISTISELLFLKERLEKNKKLPLLPIANPILSLVLYLPLLSPFIISILSIIF